MLGYTEEYWNEHPELQHIPIYYASSLAKRCMTIFQTYINMMNKKIQKEYEVSNPFVFKHIKNLKSADHFHETGPVVVMASPAMLQVGYSLYFYNGCTNKPRSSQHSIPSLGSDHAHSLNLHSPCNYKFSHH
jgi:cleavage and polyadenylation specificity factor subunit 3